MKNRPAFKKYPIVGLPEGEAIGGMDGVFVGGRKFKIEIDGDVARATEIPAMNWLENAERWIVWNNGDRMASI